VQETLTCLATRRSRQAPNAADLLVGAQCPTKVHFERGGWETDEMHVALAVRFAGERCSGR
jgi:hypothetical protein